METIFSKRSSKGQAEVVIEGNMLAVYIEGKRIGAGSPGRLPKMIQTPTGIDFTHSLAGLGLTTEEANQVQAAWKAARIAQPITPTQERAKLLSNVRDLIDAASEAFDAADNGDGTGRQFQARDAFDGRIAEAKAALAAFDAAHPEILGAAKSAQAETAQRNRWM